MPFLFPETPFPQANLDGHLPSWGSLTRPPTYYGGGVWGYSPQGIPLPALPPPAVAILAPPTVRPPIPVASMRAARFGTGNLAPRPTPGTLLPGPLALSQLADAALQARQRLAAPTDAEVQYQALLRSSGITDAQVRQHLQELFARPAPGVVPAPIPVPTPHGAAPGVFPDP